MRSNPNRSQGHAVGGKRKCPRPFSRSTFHNWISQRKHLQMENSSRIGSCEKRKKFENKLRRDYASRDQRALPTAFSGSKARRVGKEKHEEKEALLPDAYRVLHQREWINKLKMTMAVQIFSGRWFEKGELASEDRYGTLPGPGPGNCKVIGQWMMNTRLGIASGTRGTSKPSSREVE